MKTFSLLIFVSLFLISFASSVAIIEFDNTNPQPNEVIIGRLFTPGEFVDELSESDITFFDGRREVKPDFEMYYYNGEYYFYVNFKTEGSYTLRTSEVLTKGGAGVLGTIVEKNISVAYVGNGTKDILAIRPGVYYSINSPTVELVNLGESTLNLTFLDKSITLIPFESYEAIFIPKEVFSTFTISTYKTFNVPIIFLEAQNATGSHIDDDVGDIRTIDDEIEIAVNQSESDDISFELVNIGDSKISDISINNSQSDLAYNYTSFLLPREGQNITIILDSSEAKFYDDSVTINYIQDGEMHSMTIPLKIYVLPENKTLDEVLVTDKTCEELTGVFCESGLVCRGEITFAGGNCCLGECVDSGDSQDNGKKGGSGWIYGLLIVGLVGGALYYFYSKYKKAKPVTAKKNVAEVAKKYENRLKGRPVSRRVSGSLEK